MNPLILLVNQFKKLGDTAKIEAYLDLQKRLLEFTGLKADDSRLSMSVRKEGDISININSRRVLALVFRKKTWRIQIMINDDDLAEARQFEGYLSREDEAFSNRTGVPATLIRFELDTKPYQNNRLMQLWETSVLDYLPTASGTPYRKENNGCFLAATMNNEARQQLFNWMQQETLTDKDLESDEIKKLFNLDDSIVTPSVSDSNFTQNDNNMAFTWVKTHHDIVQYLKDRRAEQIELIDLLKKIGTDLFNDKDENGNNVTLDEIDPFTFFCYIYKYGNKKRLEILQALAAEINSEPIPTDEFGIPSTNPQQVWLFPYKFKRKNNEINRLWDFFEKVIADTVDETSFIDVMKIKGVGQTKLTEVLFYVNPNKYFPINEPIKQYLASKFDINHNFNTFGEYQMILNGVKAKTNAPFYQISYDAWKWNNSPKNNSLDMNNIKIEYPLNQILYGPPGTGKTYNTINKAIQIANPSFDLSQSRAIVKVEFDRLLQEGQIVFTTFHQSMSYEDFIEGIKPQREGADDQPTITYKVESGVFKRICDSASQIISTTDNFDEMYENFVNELAEKEGIELETPSQKRKFDVRVNSNKNCVATPQTPTATPMTVTKNMVRSYLLEQKIIDWKPYTIPIAEYLRKNYPIKIRTGEKLEKNAPLSMPTPKLDFETIYKAYFEEMKKRLATGTLVDLPIYTNGKKWSLKELDDNGDVLIYTQTYNKADDYVQRFKRDLKLIYKAYPNYGDVKTFSQTVKAIDIQKRLNIPNVANGLYTWFLHFKEFERVYLHQEFTPDFISYENRDAQIVKNYVLIIDEINRGNVSQIFGELITLIEDDKRLGKDEALTVTLPYSKEKFGVPSNVYIIGTMNTADRSVEALDTALRRRFSFVEMPPQYHLDELDKEIGGFYLPDILQTMNDRIEVLLNRDNLIGHSYFLKVDSEEALKETMFKNIIPLLQEYFFGDYGKIGLVLGKGFVKEEKDRKKVSFATFDYPDTEGVQKTVYELRKYDEVDIEEAIKWLLNGKA